MEIITCPECNAELQCNVDVCPNCGFPLKEKNHSIFKRTADKKREKLEREESNIESSKMKKRNILILLMAILMLIIALSNIAYIFIFLFAWLENIFNFRFFHLYTVAYFVFALESMLTTFGFASTGLILLTNKKREFLKITTFLIVGVYVLRALEKILFIIDWFEVELLLSLAISLITMSIWGVQLFLPKLGADNKSEKTILIACTVVMCLINFAFAINSSSIFEDNGMLVMIFEYIALGLFIWCNPFAVSITSLAGRITGNKVSVKENEMEKRSNDYMNNGEIKGYLQVWKLIVFSILTLGIYTFIWTYRIVGLFNEKRIGEERSQGVQVVLCMFVPFYVIYWLYKQSKLTEDYTIKVGNRSNDLTIISLVLSLFGLSLVAMALIQDQINKNLLAEYGYVVGFNLNSDNQKKDSVEITEVITEYIKVDVEAEKPKYADRISNEDIEYLKKLKELKDMGILSEEEYTEKKETVLGKKVG